MNKSKRMAISGVFSALCVIIMFLGAVLELGMYTSPLLAGVILMLIGQKYGRKWHLSMFVAVSLLCLLLVPHMEANLMFMGFFGWYPIIRPDLQKLPKIPRITAKLIIFNLSIIIIEYLVITLFIPEVLTPWMTALLLALANIAFLMYDKAIPRLEYLMLRIGKRF